MKKINITYWIFTSIFALMMLGSAIPDVISADLAVNGFRQIGYPAYLVPFLGVAKTLGVLAILLPINPRIKEWAYAGLIIDLVGATYSIYAAGQPAGSWVPMALPLAIAGASYYFFHRRIALLCAN